MRKGPILLSLVFLCGFPSFLPAQGNSPNALAGCLSGEPGSYLFAALPSGNLYRLQGDMGALAGYNNQLIQVTGNQLAPANSSQTGAFKVEKVQLISDTCTTPLPPTESWAQRPVTGTTAAGSIAINTATVADRQIPLARRGPLAPPVWEQVAQSPQEGNAGAAAVEHTEEKPAYTLGVNAVPDYAQKK